MNLGESVSKCKIFIDTVSFGYFVLFFPFDFFFRKNRQLALLNYGKFLTAIFYSDHSCNVNFPCCND